INENYVNHENINKYEPGATTPKNDTPKYLETPRHETANAPNPFSLQEA
ncbi:25623_t:CDS:1, partial [Dentiscutata erythropus]